VLLLLLLLRIASRRLTLPSRGRFPAYGLQAPLMSNVRRQNFQVARFAHSVLRKLIQRAFFLAKYAKFLEISRSRESSIGTIWHELLGTLQCGSASGSKGTSWNQFP
jgi:hypothetical protein